MLNIVSCGNSDDDLIGNWVSLYDVEPGGRSDAVSVSVNNIGYFGTGINTDNTVDRYRDWWKVDFSNKKPNYTKLDSIPGVARSGAVAFAIGEDIYVGGGYDGEKRLNDFYKYSITDGLWAQIDSFPGVARYGAVAFSVNGKGYVGTGLANNYTYLNDFYCYDPLTSKWTKAGSFGGTKRYEAVVFVINDVAYLATGKKDGYVSDFWKYNGTTNEWTQLRDIYNTDEDNSYDDDYDDIVRSQGVAFVSGEKGYEKGYITTGGKGGSGRSTWEYDPATDLWNEKTSFEGVSRGGSVSFTINDYGYVLTGSTSSTYFSDIWRFDPNAEQDDTDNGSTVF